MDTFDPVFEQMFAVRIPECDTSGFFRWQNQQFVGKSLIPYSKDVPKELQQAAANMIASSRMNCQFRVLKSGQKVPISITLDGVHYSLVECKTKE